MTSENRTWASLKNEYLHQIEKALASVKHPRSKEVVQDVRSHLDRRFADLKPQEQTWENFQAIITEMGPASDYADLLQPSAAPPPRRARRQYLFGVGLAAAVAIAAIVIPTAISDEKVGYIIAFQPVEPFEPQTARELLNAFNEEHPAGARTHHYRTQVRNESLARLLPFLRWSMDRKSVVQKIDSCRFLLIDNVGKSERSPLCSLFHRQQSQFS